MEQNPIKVDDDWGYRYFRKTTVNIHVHEIKWDLGISWDFNEIVLGMYIYIYVHTSWVFYSQTH